jgi:hypothetical protein
MSKQFYIDSLKEYRDAHRLIDQIEKSNWIDSKVTIVICSPEYSSGICQLLSHKLSHLNNHVPFDLDFLEMPYPGNELYSIDEYIEDIDTLVSKYINKDNKLLFIDSGTLRGKNFTILDKVLEGSIESERIKFGCMYIQDDSIFEPDFYVQRFNLRKDGGLTFWWENQDNPYWGW